jgi:simple sugar transport system permease protein
MSGTLPFEPGLWLPTLNPQSRLAPVAGALAIAATVLVFVLLRGTRFGLRLKATGKNAKAAFLLGVPTWQYMMASFAICGALAGIAGAVQVTAVYHRLIPSISSGYGYLGLMVAMLVNYSAALAAPIALFFAALNVGSIQLPIVLRLDSALSGVIQGTIVLFVILGEGLRSTLSARKRGKPS